MWREFIFEELRGTIERKITSNEKIIRKHFPKCWKNNKFIELISKPFQKLRIAKQEKTLWIEKNRFLIQVTHSPLPKEPLRKQPLQVNSLRTHLLPHESTNSQNFPKWTWVLAPSPKPLHCRPHIKYTCNKFLEYFEHSQWK